MKYLMIDPASQRELLSTLEHMPDYLSASFARLTSAESTTRGPDDVFSPVEQCWHLADLEREAYAVRIRRLVDEIEPWLADFDGALIAQQRNYRARSLREGLESFREARRDNLAMLRSIAPDAWTRRGTQEGVGAVSLCDIPAMMAEHDAVHRAEIEAWIAATRPRA